MLIAVFGTPSPLTYWITNFIRTTCDIVYGAHCFITPITIENLREGWAAREGRPVVIQSVIPQREIVDLFVELEAPIYLVADDPVDVVMYVKASHNLQFREAARFASQSFSILSNINSYSNIEIVDASWYNLSASQLLERIAVWFGLRIPNDKYEAVLQHFVTHDGERRHQSVLSLVVHSDPLARQPGAYMHLYDPIEEKIINDVIIQYGKLLHSTGTDIIVWPREIFPDRDNLDRILDGPRPLLGPARILFGGHTLHLPAGKWRAVIDIEVLNNHSRNRLIAQVYAGEKMLCMVRGDLPVSGRFAVDVDFAIQDGYYPVQVVLAIAEGAIEGEILLHSCMFTRQDCV